MRCRYVGRRSDRGVHARATIFHSLSARARDFTLAVYLPPEALDIPLNGANGRSGDARFGEHDFAVKIAAIHTAVMEIQFVKSEFGSDRPARAKKAGRLLRAARFLFRLSQSVRIETKIGLTQHGCEPA
jgi:hypothetical protein